MRRVIEVIGTSLGWFSFFFKKHLKICITVAKLLNSIDSVRFQILHGGNRI